MIRLGFAAEQGHAPDPESLRLSVLVIPPLASTIMDIICAKSRQEIDEIRRLFREYEAYLNVDLCFQQFETELANLPGKYAPPSGALLLAMDGQKAIGCGALRSLDSIQDRPCEMKRLYVCPEVRGLGVGKLIAKRLIQEGVRLGYSTMVLDTLDRLEAAIHLYESLGFVRTKPYYENPLPGVVYLKLDLIGQHVAAAESRGRGNFGKAM